MLFLLRERKYAKENSRGLDKIVHKKSDFDIYSNHNSNTAKWLKLFLYFSDFCAECFISFNVFLSKQNKARIFDQGSL